MNESIFEGLQYKRAPGGFFRPVVKFLQNLIWGSVDFWLIFKDGDTYVTIVTGARVNFWGNDVAGVWE